MLILIGMSLEHFFPRKVEVMNNSSNVQAESTPASSANLNFGDTQSKRARRIKGRKALKIVLIGLISLLLVIVCAGTAIIMPLIQAYNNGYTKVPIISGPDSFKIPDFPTGSIDVGNTGDPSDTTEEEFIPPKDPDTVNGIYKVDQKDPDIENILLVGTDSRNMSSLKGRSDTMIICSYNKRTGEAKLISLLRDMLVPIPGIGENGKTVWQRLNAAYSLGNIAVTINTINQLFDLDIQRFVIINFQGTEKLVDKCGGVDLKLTKGEVEYIAENGGTVTNNGNGTYHLDGKAALTHMRHRKDSSDYKRTERQRNVITALFRQVVGSRNLTDIYNLVQKSFNMIQTNISLDEVMDLAESIVSNGSNMKIDSHRLPMGTAGSVSQGADYGSIYFHMNKQIQVGAGQGGAAVIQINIESQRKQLQKLIYG